MLKFESYSEAKVRAINDYLESNLRNFRASVSQRFAPLVESMHYSLEGGGKRLRPLLIVASAECIGINTDDILPAACAMEYIHSYSLVHDDLPALDDDDMRRGKPSSHKRFGEAIAILTGDALVTEAFGLMIQLHQKGKFPAENVLSAIDTLVHYSGVRGMVGGQLLDVTAEHPNYNLPEVEFIHIHKTGALILGSVLLPTKLKPVEDELMLKLRRYGEAVGLAFQISDDLLDSEASLRYSRGPRKKPKPSYSQLMSHTEMKQKMNGLIDSAVQALASEGERAQPLIAIAEFIRTRKN
jgi:geranylgeranyl diphosphate synthase, type II